MYPNLRADFRCFLFVFFFSFYFKNNLDSHDLITRFNNILSYLCVPFILRNLSHMKAKYTIIWYFPFILFWINVNNVYPEGVKQLLPDTTTSHADLTFDNTNSGWSYFGLINCSQNYRLNIHVRNTGESILFGLGLKNPISPIIHFNLKKPNGTVVLSGQCPANGQTGFINYYHQAFVGPFPSYGGYTPLEYDVTSIADTGDYYFEITDAPSGFFAQAQMFTLWDFQIVSGAHFPAIPDDTINGRVFSKSWQLYASLSGPFQPFNGSFYVFSDDGIVTKLAFNTAHIGEFDVFCNPYGCLNTGNFTTDRQSKNSNTSNSFPGIAQYKVFLNNPDTNVYPDGVYGSMIGTPYIIPDPNYPACSGKKYIVVDVNKTGNVEVDITFPYGGSATNVTLFGNVVPGLNNIPWNGLDGLGNQVPDGTQITVAVKYVNGLTNLPIWDQERNPEGFIITLIRPVNPSLQNPLTYWDDSQLTNSGQCSNPPTTVNLTGCSPGSMPGIPGCHPWDVSGDCHNKMINTWWYSASTSTATLSYFYTGIPGNPIGHGTSRCGPGVDTIHATVDQFQTVDWYAAATGGVPLLTGDTSFITPFLSVTTTYYAQARNDTSGCLSPGRTAVTATIKPVPNVIFTPPSQSICSNDTTDIALSSTTPGPSFSYSWTATASSPDVTGFSSGMGNLIHQKLTESGNHSDTVTYHVTPSSQGCAGSTNNVKVVVNPRPHLITNPLSDAICSGHPTNIILISSCTGTSFTWTASLITGVITGFSNGSGNAIIQTLIDAQPISGEVLYTILPIAGGCIGNDTDYFTTVKPKPHVTNNPLTAQACSNTVSNITLISDLTGAIFTWTATGSSGNVSGFSAGSGSTITQTLVNSGFNLETVTYHIIPHANGCDGDTTNFIVTVFPVPDVYFTPPSQILCSGTTSNIHNLSHVTGATFTWTASGSSPNISGYSSGSGDMIQQTLTNSGYAIESVNYTVTPVANGCTGTFNHVIITVDPLPAVSLTSCWDPVTTTNAQPIILKGGIPLGGIYSGTGVNSGTFYPGTAGTGGHTISYSYVNVYGCSRIANQTISVIPPPAFTCGNTLTDIRDTKQYSTVKIGIQCWMSANLNYGNNIVSGQMQRDNCIPEKYCYNNNPSNCSAYGGLYQWDELMQFSTVNGAQGFCPPAWHIPTETDWTTLFNFYISNGFAGSPLKFDGFSGFDAFLTGVRHENVGWDWNTFAIFLWTSTAEGTTKAWAHGMNNVDPSVNIYPSSRDNAFAVRCIKD